MKVVILAGGYGTRISEYSHLMPKPMIEIGGKPIIWHIMKIYFSYGFNDFVICCGYKAYIIKSYFADYYLHNSDVTFDFGKENSMEIHNNFAEPWRVTLVDTGINTMTGGRIKKIQPHIGDNDFMLIYGDGVSDIDIKKLLAFHKSHGKYATITATNVAQRFGVLDIEVSGLVKDFREKPDTDRNVVNIGFMVFSSKIFDYIKDDETVLEKEPLETLAKQSQLMAYKHDGFWQCMDTQRDMMKLEELWMTGGTPWKVW